MDELPTLQKPLTLDVAGRSTRCDLKRHLAPRTVGIIQRSLPLEGNVHRMGGSIVYIETALDSGMERARTGFRGGDVAFLPSAGAVCFFARDASARPMTPIGRLHDPGVLEDAGPGDVLRLYAG